MTAPTLADRIEALKQRVFQISYAGECTPVYALAVDLLDALLDSRDALRAAAAVRDAWEMVGIGGNHLASLLTMRVGTDFAERYPPDADQLDTLAALGQDDYDIWACWSNIMRARALKETGA